MNREPKTNSSALRNLPSVDALLRTRTAQILLREKIDLKRLTEAARRAIDDLRGDLIAKNDANLNREQLVELAETKLAQHIKIYERRRLQPVINATGVVIHTNLGRAPLAEAARAAILENAGYCTLEYDLETGKRGRRAAFVEELICELTGADAALVVNNCAAAAFLVLSELGAGGEAIVSRGELVEIGGDFRVPDVMAQSGTKLVEVGTTNRTRLSDFAQAINEKTKMLVRVHPSNFRIVGFTAMPALAEMAQLAAERDLILYEDAGSGALVDLSRFGLTDEPVIKDSIKAGADVVTFSADKLLGAAQAGIIVGREKIIERLRKNPLYRALRVGKIVSSALAATLEIYRRENHFAEIPVLRMLSTETEAIERRAEDFIQKLKQSEISNLRFEISPGESAIGGGSAPLARLETILIALRHQSLSTEKLEQALRLNSPPIIARTSDDKVLLDLRTIADSECDEIVRALRRILEDNQTNESEKN